MSAELDLFRWVKSQEQAGDVESSGTFTIDKATAWQKLGAFALPFEHAWVVKVVQSAVCCGSDLKIEQSRTQTTIHWLTPPDWTQDMVESAMLNSQPGEKALDHLAVGLRALAKATDLPFGLSYPDGTTTYWTGQGFTSTSDSPKGELRLGVGHFKVGESSSILSSDKVRAVGRMTSIAQALAARAHCCPNTITLDRRNVSNVFQEPLFGSSSLSHPLYFLQAPPQPELPSLRLRARFLAPTVKMTQPLAQSARGEVTRLNDELSEPCLAGLLITAFTRRKIVPNHSRKNPQNEISYVAAPRPSVLVWVTDGVEVAREDLEMPHSPTALLVYCSAEGLPTDLSGLTPRHTELLGQRRTAVMRAVQRCLEAADVDSKVSTSSAVNVGLVVVSGLLTLANPFLGLGAIVGGGYSFLAQRGKNSSLEKEMDEGLEKLRDGVNAKWKP